MMIMMLLSFHGRLQSTRACPSLSCNIYGVHPSDFSIPDTSEASIGLQNIPSLRTGVMCLFFEDSGSAMLWTTSRWGLLAMPPSKTPSPTSSFLWGFGYNVSPWQTYCKLWRVIEKRREAGCGENDQQVAQALPNRAKVLPQSWLDTWHIVSFKLFSPAEFHTNGKYWNSSPHKPHWGSQFVQHTSDDRLGPGIGQPIHRIHGK